MPVFTRNPSRVSVMDRSEALTRNLLLSGKHTALWDRFTVSADIIKQRSMPTGKRAHRG